MNYKDTLHLPKTDFPMKADLVTREPERLKIWEEQGLYAQIQEARKAVEVTTRRKCARCWRHREAVGAIPAHPELCERCAEVVSVS